MSVTTAVDVMRAPIVETLPRLSASLAGTIPHRALAHLFASCAFAPFQVHETSAGRPGPAITTAEVAALRPLVEDSGSWQGRARLGGTDVPALVLASTMAEPAALLVFVRSDDTLLNEEHLAPTRALWDLLTAHGEGLRTEPTSGALAVSRAAAAARATAISELVDAHGAALTGLLGVLRDRDLDDASARARAVNLTVTALAELRAQAELDQAMVEERAGHAFQRLADSLRRILRARNVRLDLGTPGAEEGADRLLPSDVVNAGQAAIRATVHALLEDQGHGPDGRQVGRFHVS